MSDAARVIKKPKTWRDLEELPEGVNAEIVGGEIVVMPRPGGRHMRSQRKISRHIGGAFELGAGGPGGWEIIVEPGIQFGDEYRIPDVAGWRSERFEEPEEGPYLVIPDWICEVISTNSETRDRIEKLQLYAKHGVRHYWLVNPALQTLEVYRLDGKFYSVINSFGGDERVRAEPFDAIELDLSLLWMPKKPEPPLTDAP